MIKQNFNAKHNHEHIRKEKGRLKRKTIAVVLAMLCFGMLISIFHVHPTRANVITVPDQYPTIQAAINAAAWTGDTIFVRNGTYYEHIYIDKSLTLVGEDKYATIIDGSGYGSKFLEYGAVVTITGLEVNFTNFTVQNAGWADMSGVAVYLHLASFCSINNLVILNSRFGIAPLFYSRDNTISDNTISDAEIGIVNYNPLPSVNNKVIGNRISNSSAGIYFNYPQGVQVIGNMISNSSRYSYGIHFQSGGSDNKIIGNIVENSDNAIRVDYADENVISENTVSDNTYGVFVGYESSDNIVCGNNASDSNIGIMIWDNSNNNTVINNEASNNYYGIGILSSNQNRIFHNNFWDNTYQVLNIGDSANVWDDDYPTGGNYWSDYTGTDLNHDGIGDEPYPIDTNNADRYPLMNTSDNYPYVSPTYNLTIVATTGGTTNPTSGTYTYVVGSSINVTISSDIDYSFDHWELDSVNVGSANPYTVLMDKNHTLKAVKAAFGDADGNGKVDMDDVTTVLAAFGSHSTHPRWNPIADLNHDGKVDLADIIIVLENFGKHYT